MRDSAVSIQCLDAISMPVSSAMPKINAQSHSQVHLFVLQCGIILLLTRNPIQKRPCFAEKRQCDCSDRKIRPKTPCYAENSPCNRSDCSISRTSSCAENASYLNVPSVAPLPVRLHQCCGLHMKSFLILQTPSFPSIPPYHSRYLDPYVS